jgi:hypothetical protein
MPDAGGKHGRLFHLLLLSMVCECSDALAPLPVQHPEQLTGFAEGFTKFSKGLRGGKLAEIGALDSWTFTEGRDSDGDLITVFRHLSGFVVEVDHNWSDGGVQFQSQRVDAQVGRPATLWCYLSAK